jgi:tetrahydromethanopterin S-methyltransferase subunit E
MAAMAHDLQVLKPIVIVIKILVMYAQLVSSAARMALVLLYHFAIDTFACIFAMLIAAIGFSVMCLATGTSRFSEHISDFGCGTPKERRNFISSYGGIQGQFKNLRYVCWRYLGTLPPSTLTRTGLAASFFQIAGR